MAALNLFNPTLAGGANALVAAQAGGDSFPMPGPIVVRIANGSGGAITVTFAGQKACNQGFTHNNAVAVPAGATWDVRLDDTDRFADANGRVQLTYSGVTSLTVGAYRIG